MFAIGTTTVYRTASGLDDNNNPVTVSFIVTVKDAATQLADLHQAAQEVGPSKSLSDKVPPDTAIITRSE